MLYVPHLEQPRCTGTLLLNDVFIKNGGNLNLVIVGSNDGLTALRIKGPSMNRNNIGCPPASCPIQGFNSSMPAVPFWAMIEGGKCTVITTNGAPAKGFKEL